MAVNEAWLARHTEAAIEPELPIVDPHHHLWDNPAHRPGERYTGEEHMARDMRSGHRIVATVYAECTPYWRTTGPEHLRPVGEVETVNAVADRCLALGVPVAAGIVGCAHFQWGAIIEETLAAHIEAAPKRFRGIRQTLAWDSDEHLRYRHLPTFPHRSYDPKWREGYAKLEKFGLSFDAWAYSTQLHEVVDLARAFPGIPVVIDHLGGPLGAFAYAEPTVNKHILMNWRNRLKELAACPNVFMKLGGMAMHCAGLHFGPAHRELPPTSDELVTLTGDYYKFAIDTFSPARCMFESNFPVDKESLGTVELWNSFKKLSAGYSAGERADLFAGTACRVYKLDLDELIRSRKD